MNNVKKDSIPIKDSVKLMIPTVLITQVHSTVNFAMALIVMITQAQQTVKFVKLVEEDISLLPIKTIV